MAKKIAGYSLIAILLFGLMVGYSYTNPGRIGFLDALRVPVQSLIMAYFGNFRVDTFNILDESGYGHAETISMSDMQVYFDILKPGDILFTNSEKYISSQLIPGVWKHSVIYLGEEKQVFELFGSRHEVSRTLRRHKPSMGERLIIDSSVHGVSIRSFQDLSGMATESMLNGISAFRINRDDEAIKRFITHAFQQLGKPYDYDLITGNTEALYCSELIYESLKQLDIELHVGERMYGRDVVSPNGAFNYMEQIGVPAGEVEQLFVIEKKHGEIVNTFLKNPY